MAPGYLRGPLQPCSPQLWTEALREWKWFLPASHCQSLCHLLQFQSLLSPWNSLWAH